VGEGDEERYEGVEKGMRVERGRGRGIRECFNGQSRMKCQVYDIEIGIHF
jgi:hypothetical protein